MLKRALVGVATLAFGSKPALHRVPFGPLRGRQLCNSPQISLRMLLGMDEEWVTDIIRRELTSDAVAFDVGAHIGYTTVAMAGTGATVHAFELHPATAALLECTANANRDLAIHVHPVGLGCARGQIRLPLGETYMTAIRSENGEGALCTIETMDAYREQEALPLPDFVKIDVEMAEIDCLNGARETLRHRPPLLIEFHTGKLLTEGLALLRDMGYTHFVCEHPEAMAKVRGFCASVICRA
ncbi:MAG: hypothetical protein JWM95_4241 [Gemmatimonadetes bacterium]|nr:hypothetical protein [Gemmatimonadota bacterium]